MTHEVSATAKSLLAAATLATGATIDRWSRTGALAALIALLILPSPSVAVLSSLCLSLLASLGQAFHAVRTSLDERVFAHWSQHWQRDPASVNEDLSGFDATLQDQFGKRTKPRTLDARIQAATDLLRWQALSLGAQLALLALGIAFHHWGTQL